VTTHCQRQTARDSEGSERQRETARAARQRETARQRSDVPIALAPVPIALASVCHRAVPSRQRSDVPAALASVLIALISAAVSWYCLPTALIASVLGPPSETARRSASGSSRPRFLLFGSWPLAGEGAGTTAAAGSVVSGASSSSVTTHCQRETARDSEGTERQRETARAARQRETARQRSDVPIALAPVLASVLGPSSS
jgi:hypothetical protein